AGGPGRGGDRRLRRALRGERRNRHHRRRGHVLPAAAGAARQRSGGIVMAVYTDVSTEELAGFLAGYDIGELLSYKGIAEGVENSNFIVHTRSGNFILTLYEKRVAASDLPFFLSLMDHLPTPPPNSPQPRLNPS